MQHLLVKLAGAKSRFVNLSLLAIVKRATHTPHLELRHSTNAGLARLLPNLTQLYGIQTRVNCQP